jgi:hypothetical protein
MVVTNNVYLDKKFIDGRIKLFKELFTFYLDKPDSLVGFISDKVEIDPIELVNHENKITACEIRKADATIIGFDIWAHELNNKLFSKLLGIQYHGHYAEWVKDYPDLFRMQRLLVHFTSFKNFKRAVGLTHFSDEEVLAYFELQKSEDNRTNSINLFKIVVESENVRKTFLNVIHHTTNGDVIMLRDYIRMCDKVKRKPEIPKGFNKLKKIHDELVDIINQDKLDSTSKEVVVEAKPIEGQENRFFVQEWKRRGLDFIHLNSEFLLKKQGIYQKHCIGGYATKSGFKASSFFSFKWNGRRYDCQLRTDGKINQFKGYRNGNAPEELRELVEKDVFLNHEINYFETEAVK